jgi:thioesterase domain-containing protein
MTADSDRLENTWHRRIPLAAAMQLKVSDYNSQTLKTTAPLAPNVNLHGTAFAGSLYSICALTGWGYIWRAGRQIGIEGEIVLGRGEIAYLRPVTGEIVCAASTNNDDEAELTAALTIGQSGRCSVNCTIESDGLPAVEFSGVYRFRLCSTDQR